MSRLAMALVLSALGAGCGGPRGGRDAGAEADGGWMLPPSCPGQMLSTAGVLDLDVPLVRVTGRITTDGAPPSGAVSSLVLELEHDELGLRHVLDARNVAGSGDYTLSIPPGTYTIRSRGLTTCDAAPTLPCNAGVVRASVALTTDGTLDLDLATAVLDATVTVAGAPASRGSVHVAAIDGGGAAEVPIALGHARVRLLRGSYRVAYRRIDCDRAEPCGRHSHPGTVALSTDGVLDLPVPAVSVSGVVRLDGAPAATGLSFEWIDDGEPFVVPLSGGAYDVQMVPSTYDLRVAAPLEACEPGRALPCVPATVRRAVAMQTSGVLDVDVETLEVTGRITVAGASLAGGGRLRVVGEAGEGVTPLLATSAGTFGARLVRGDYAVRFDGEPADCVGLTPAAAPCNDGELLARRAFSASGVLDLDVPLAHVTGAVTTSVSGPASVRLVRPDDGTSEIRVPVIGGTYAVSLIPASYHVSWTSSATPCELTFAACLETRLRDAHSLTSSGVLDLVVPTFVVEGTLRLDGAAPATTGEGLLAFRSSDERTYGHVPVDAASTFALPLASGRYVVSYDPARAGLCEDGERHGACGEVVAAGCTP